MANNVGKREDADGLFRARNPRGCKKNADEKCRVNVCVFLHGRFFQTKIVLFYFVAVPVVPVAHLRLRRCGRQGQPHCDLQRHSRDNNGALPSTESFLNGKGSFDGYTQRLCLRLSVLFDLEFRPQLRDWDEIIAGLADGGIDFSGDLIPTPERRKKYFMTGPIAERSITVFAKAESLDIYAVAKRRPPRLGFLTGSVHLAPFRVAFKPAFEPVYVDNFETAAAMLRNNTIDAFINESVSRSFFARDAFIVSEDFFPLTYIPVSLTTQKADLQVIVAVVDKYLARGGLEDLEDLYSRGMYDYNKYSLFQQFTPEEKAYIEKILSDGTTIPVALESDNYPTCFYNEIDKAFEGIVPDVLREISGLTGLRFTPVAGTRATWPEVFEMLKDGRAAMISELIQSEARADKFLWADKPYCVTPYAFLSRMDYPDLEIYQVLSKRVGVLEATAYEDMYEQWFSGSKPVVYPGISEAFEALDRGEIELFLASQNMLLNQTNYHRNPGYKANIVLRHPMASKFGFSKREAILCSIVGKAQDFAKTEIITTRWESRTFDYASELSRTRATMLLAGTVLLSAFLVLLIMFLVRNRSLRIKLEKTVRERTRELELQTAAAQAASKAKSAFLARMSHEIRTPLAWRDQRRAGHVENRVRQTGNHRRAL